MTSRIEGALHAQVVSTIATRAATANRQPFRPQRKP